MNNFQPPPWATQTQTQVAAPPGASQPAQAPMFPPQAPQYAPQAPQNYGPMPTAPQAPQYAPQGYGPPGAPPAGLAPQGLPSQDFDGVGDAKVYAKTPFFPIGSYVVQIDEVKAIRSQNPASQGQPKVIIVATVLESNVNGAVGSQYAQTINLAKYGKPDLKMFVGAACGADPGKPEQLQALVAQGAFTPESMVQLCGATQPLRGRKLKLTTYEKPTKPTPQYPAGAKFTMHAWTPYTG